MHVAETNDLCAEGVESIYLSWRREDPPGMPRPKEPLAPIENQIRWFG